MKISRTVTLFLTGLAAATLGPIYLAAHEHENLQPATVTPTVNPLAKTATDEDPWVSLFTGKDLTGWVQHNGTATYKVADGVVTGTTAQGSPNSFMCTKKNYADFELTFEVKCDSQLNSGVQIRSISDKSIQNGRVHGPQVEIEASPGEAGYIYGEATGRGWLSDPVTAHSHFKNDQWNEYRVLAQGDRIQTWINGEKVADLTDEKSSKKGFIGLQVHSIGADQGPFDVSWRKIKIREIKSQK